MAEQLTPFAGKRISKAEAKRWIENYKAKNPDQVYAEFYGSAHLHEILKQDGCVGIRIYITTGDGTKNQLVLVGAKEDGTNICPPGISEKSEDDGILLDHGLPCPPVCPGLDP